MYVPNNRELSGHMKQQLIEMNDEINLQQHLEISTLLTVIYRTKRPKHT